MAPRRVLPLVIAVTGLLAVAALAAHGRPIGHSHGTGPTASFFDYVFTTVAIVLALLVIVYVYSLVGTKWSRPAAQRSRLNLLQLAATVLAALLFGWFLAHAHFHFTPRPQTRTHVGTTLTGAGDSGTRTVSPLNRRNARIKWGEVAVVAGFFAVVALALFMTRSAKPAREWALASHEELAVALDESLDDLRSEPDVRRAIIAAYARMERALAVAGLPRRPSEAPLEYLSRALQSLHLTAGAVTRLTDLFERAKFSHHEVDESMRTEAIDALVAVRDELRRPVGAAA